MLTRKKAICGIAITSSEIAGRSMSSPDTNMVVFKVKETTISICLMEKFLGDLL